MEYSYKISRGSSRVALISSPLHQHRATDQESGKGDHRSAGWTSLAKGVNMFSTRHYNLKLIDKIFCKYKRLSCTLLGRSWT